MTKQDVIADFNGAVAELNKDLETYAAFFTDVNNAANDEKRDEIVKAHTEINTSESLLLLTILQWYLCVIPFFFINAFISEIFIVFLSP